MDPTFEAVLKRPNRSTRPNVLSIILMVMHSRRWVWSCLCLLFLASILSAQLAFDVASVKENKNLADGGSLQLMPGGGLRAAHIPARALVTVAYSLDGYQLIGASDWAATTYYDVNARPAGAATREQTLQMLQTLLATRFKLASHREQRRLGGFALTRVRPDALGPNLRRSDVDCENSDVFAATPRCRQGGITLTTLKAAGSPIWTLLQVIKSHMRAPVSDETGLDGPFDIDLHWSNDVAPADDVPTMTGALRDQLGLKLERRDVEVDVFIVDHMERPTPD